MKKFALVLFILVAVVVSVPGIGGVQAQGKTLKVVASTTIIRDIAQNVAGDKQTIDFLVPTNGDVHAFEPKPEDIRKLADADVILVNGAGLERFLDRLIADSGTKAKVVTVSRGLPIRKFGVIGDQNATPDPASGVLGISGAYQCGAPKEGEDIGECDPHLWQNVTNVIGYVLNIRDALSEADPANADAYNANAGVYIAKLQQLDADIFLNLSGIPAENRVLVTNHDALGYFAARYGFRIAGVVIPGGTAGQEPDPKQVAGLIKTIQTQNVKAIFLENVASDKLAQQIGEQSGAKVVQALYTDALGEAGTPGETYLGMMQANLKALQDALK